MKAASKLSLTLTDLIRALSRALLASTDSQVFSATALGAGAVFAYLALFLLLAPRNPAAMAKRDQKTWAYSVVNPERGFAVDPQNQPPVFSDLFPGYPATLRSDSQFWLRYYSYAFNADRRVPSVGAASDMVVATPWKQCVDLLHSYGADTLVLGNSETYRALSSDLVPGLGRVAFCTRSSLLPEGALAVLQTLPPQLRLKRVLLGYSLSWHYPDQEKREQILSEQLREMRATARTHALSWNWFLPFSAFTRDTLAAQITVAEPSWHPRPGTLSQGAREKNFRILSSDFPLLDSQQLQPKPYYRLTQKNAPAGCEREREAALTLSQLLSAALARAERVYVFTPPITPSAQENYSPCLEASLTRALRRGRPEGQPTRLHTYVGKMADYGLNWQDFAVVTAATSPHAVVTIDPNHVNAKGSRRFSQWLRTWIVREEKL